MTNPRPAALLIALALVVTGCSGPVATHTTPPTATAPASVAAPPTTDAPAPSTTPAPTVAAASALPVAKAVLDALSVKCAGAKITGTATEVYDTCYCVGALVTSGGTMAGQMPDGRAVADTCPALIAKAQE